MKVSQIFGHWQQVRHDLLATIDKFSQEELDYAPFKSSWPVGQIMLHIADCEDNWMHGVVRKEIKPWVFYNLPDYPSMHTIKGMLDGAHQKTIAFLDELNEGDLKKIYQIPDGESASLYWIIWHVLEHEIHHRGELSLALGLLGREGLDV